MTIFRPHSVKQEAALFSDKPITVLSTGIQFGKSVCGAMRIKMLMHKYTDPRDNFLIVAPTYKILQQATLPEFLRVMSGCGDYNKTDAFFKMHSGGTCWIRTGTDPDSIVGITNIRGVWGDEAGLFSLYFHENIQARASIKEAQIIYTTSPYSLNWIYTDYIRKKMKGTLDYDVEVIQARSNENPYFPAAEYERKKRTMDQRRFNMMYGGEYNKIDGLVYDCFDPEIHIIPPKELDHRTVYVAGVDWGYTNPTAIVIIGVCPDGSIYVVNEFYKTGQTITDIIEVCTRFKKVYNIERFYCDPSSPANISEMNKHKLTALGADNDIRAGIDAVYSMIVQNKVRVFDRAKNLIDELSIYHYPTPTDVTADKDIKEQLPVKQHDHACLAAGMVVETTRGAVNIEDVQAGDYVLCPIGYTKVIESGKTGEKEVFHVEFEGGFIQLTDDHPIFNADDFSFDTFRYCDNVLAWNGTAKNSLLMVIIGGVLAWCERVNRLQFIYTAKFGKRTMAKSEKAGIFTIKTRIRIITILKTWKQWTAGYIFPYMRITKAEDCQRQPCSLPQNGIGQKPGWNGIKNMVKGHGIIGDIRRIYARYAIKSLKQGMEQSRNSAGTIARLRIAACLELITRLENAPFVKNLLKLTGTGKLKPARILAAESISVKNVYNLKTESGCFYANGILVSNCDSFRYVLFALSKTKGYFNQRAPVSPHHKDIDYRLHVVDDLLKKRVNDVEYDW